MKKETKNTRDVLCGEYGLPLRFVENLTERQQEYLRKQSEEFKKSRESMMNIPNLGEYDPPIPIVENPTEDQKEIARKLMEEYERRTAERKRKEKNQNKTD